MGTAGGRLAAMFLEVMGPPLLRAIMLFWRLPTMLLVNGSPPKCAHPQQYSTTPPKAAAKKRQFRRAAIWRIWMNSAQLCWMEADEWEWN